MVMKCRIKISTDPILNPLNIEDSVISESNEGENVTCLEDSFSYDKGALNTALDQEEIEDDSTNIVDDPIDDSGQTNRVDEDSIEREEECW